VARGSCPGGSGIAALRSQGQTWESGPKILRGLRVSVVKNPIGKSGVRSTPYRCRPVGGPFGGAARRGFVVRLGPLGAVARDL